MAGFPLRLLITKLHNSIVKIINKCKRQKNKKF